jgi:hypothetical protein
VAVVEAAKTLSRPNNAKFDKSTVSVTVMHSSALMTHSVPNNTRRMEFTPNFGRIQHTCTLLESVPFPTFRYFLTKKIDVDA